MSDARVILFGLGAGLVLVIGAALIGRKAIAGATAAMNAVNPFNNQNVLAEGVNTLGETISNQPGWSLGGWIYDLTRRENEGARAVEPSYPRGGGAGGNW